MSKARDLADLLDSSGDVKSAKLDNVPTYSDVTDTASGLMKKDHKIKLAGIETGATGDQSNAEIKTAYEANANTNTYNDAEKTKLAGIEAGATGDQSNAEIKTAYEANANTNEFSDAEQTKLSGIATSANNYSHPSYNGDDFSIDTGHLSGATVIDDIDINVTTDSLGHVTDANGTVATRNLTLSDLGYSGATNANYITNNNQLTNGAGYITSSSTPTLTHTTYSMGGSSSQTKTAPSGYMFHAFSGWTPCSSAKEFPHLGSVNSGGTSVTVTVYSTGCASSSKKYIIVWRSR